MFIYNINPKFINPKYKIMFETTIIDVVVNKQINQFLKKVKRNLFLIEIDEIKEKLAIAES